MLPPVTQLLQLPGWAARSPVHVRSCLLSKDGSIEPRAVLQMAAAHLGIATSQETAAQAPPFALVQGPPGACCVDIRATACAIASAAPKTSSMEPALPTFQRSRVQRPCRSVMGTQAPSISHTDARHLRKRHAVDDSHQPPCPLCSSDRCMQCRHGQDAHRDGHPERVAPGGLPALLCGHGVRPGRAGPQHPRHPGRPGECAHWQVSPLQQHKHICMCSYSHTQAC